MGTAAHKCYISFDQDPVLAMNTTRRSEDLPTAKQKVALDQFSAMVGTTMAVGRHEAEGYQI